MRFELGGLGVQAPDRSTLDDVSDKAGHTCLRFGFPNGYTASIVRGPNTYGGDRGLYEGAVVHKDYGIVYDTPITSDVEGWLTTEKAIVFIESVAALPVRK